MSPLQKVDAEKQEPRHLGYPPGKVGEYGQAYQGSLGNGNMPGQAVSTTTECQCTHHMKKMEVNEACP